MTLETLLAAILTVESGGNPNPPDGDGGRSIGPYQIQRAYWEDSKETFPYEWCRNEFWARVAMKAYWKRYCSAELARVQAGKGTLKDCEVLARTHNGGPNGAKKKATMAYWRKVQNAAKTIQQKGNK